MRDAVVTGDGSSVSAGWQSLRETGVNERWQLATLNAFGLRGWWSGIDKCRLSR